MASIAVGICIINDLTFEHSKERLEEGAAKQGFDDAGVMVVKDCAYNPAEKAQPVLVAALLEEAGELRQLAEELGVIDDVEHNSSGAVDGGLEDVHEVVLCGHVHLVLGA